MEHDCQPTEIASPQIEVAETSLVFRLEPTKPSGRYLAVVAAENEEQARRFAADADPFGAEWQSAARYRCVLSHGVETHVVGDVMFQSVPPRLPAIGRP